MPDDDSEGVTAGDVRADETLGIDRSEQSGLGGDSSVLEEYGKDTEDDDLPEKAPLDEAVLQGSDPDVPKDLANQHGAPDPNLPKPGHETHKDGR